MTNSKHKKNSVSVTDKCTYQELRWYLKNKHNISEEKREKYKYLIDNFSECWEVWNKVRWDAALENDGLGELKEYYGPKFNKYFDSSWEIAKRWNKQQPKTEEEIANFYKSAEEYTYNLMVWFSSGDRRDFRDSINKLVKLYNLESVIDYGCGVGNDGLYFLEKDLTTYFVDFDCPATKFLKWRLRKRKLKTNFIDVTREKKLPAADMFWAIDVLEHMTNPVSVVDKLSEKCKVFVHRSKFNDNAGGRHPCHMSFEQQKLNKSLIDNDFEHVDWNGLSVWVRDV